MSTPEQIAMRLESAIPQIAQILKDGELLACKDMEGAIKARIFNRGLNAAGQKIGSKYSKGYVRVRERAGRQTAYVDLQLSGNLFNSIVTGERSGDTVVGITNSVGDKVADNNTKKAEVLEEKYKQEIFKPSKDEIKEAIGVMKEHVIQEIKKLLRP